MHFCPCRKDIRQIRPQRIERSRAVPARAANSQRGNDHRPTLDDRSATLLCYDQRYGRTLQQKGY